MVFLAIGAAFIGFVVALMLRRPCLALGLVDVPDERKQHGRAIPIAGGPAIAITVITLIIPFAGDQIWHVCAAGILLLIAGIADDRYRLSVGVRLVTQFMAAGILIAGGFVLTSMGSLGELGFLSIPFTVLCVVSFINACNMVDGADGLLAGVTAPACLGLAFVVPASLQPIALLMGGALFGFLVVNFPARPGSRRSEWRTFLGNGGVQFVAVVMSALMLAATGPGGSLKSGAVPWLVLIPLAELANTFARRMLGRKTAVTSADRSHFHHRLQIVGVTPVQLASGYTVVATIGVAIAVTASMLIATDTHLWAFGAAILGASTTYAVAPHSYSHLYVHGLAPDLRKESMSASQRRAAEQDGPKAPVGDSAREAA